MHFESFRHHYKQTKPTPTQAAHLNYMVNQLYKPTCTYKEIKVLSQLSAINVLLGPTRDTYLAVIKVVLVFSKIQMSAVL